MEKEIILENLDENIVNEATFYNQQNIPSQISKALYLYGSTTDYQVLGFVDASDDGSQGMIFTDQGVYFCFKEPHFFLYEDIEELVLVKKEEGFDFYAKIKTKANTFVFKNKYLNLIIKNIIINKKITANILLNIIELIHKVVLYILIRHIL